MKERDDWKLTSAIKHEQGSGDPFAAAVRATRMPMIITDPNQHDNPIIFCNEAFQWLTGYSREEIVGRNCRFLQGPQTDPVAVKALHSAIANGIDIEVELLNYRKDGTEFWNNLYLSPVRNHAGEIQFFFASQVDISARVRTQQSAIKRKREVEREVERRTAELETALEAQTLLLHEVDHRVKNNLNMIGSLLRLQARTVANPALTAELESMRERIDALANVHRILYQSDDITQFDMGVFIEHLVSDVVSASGRSDITFSIDAVPLKIASANAAAFGLLLNEILSNALKHGFSAGQQGQLGISVTQEGPLARIVIADNGRGLIEFPPHRGLGTQMILRLAKQVGADVEWSDAQPGVKVSLAFQAKQP